LSVTKVEVVDATSFRISADGVTSPLAWPHKPSLFFGAVPLSFLEVSLGTQIHLIENTLVNGLGAWVVLMAGVIVTAGFVPNMLRKGAIDLMLTKPLARPTILIYKYLGGLIFVMILAIVAYGGIWIAIGLRTGVWAPGLLYCIPGVTFYFAILYAFSTLLGVLTRNALVSILLTIGFWFVIWIIGTVHNTLTVLDNLEIQGAPPGARMRADAKKPPKAKDEQPKEDGAKEEEESQFEGGPPKPPATLVKVFKILNMVTPRTKDLDTLTSNLITRDLLSEGEQRQEGMKLRSTNWGEVLGVAGAYILAFLGIALLRFVTRSY
jgi:ABC-type transport system involved in multi-copper enzyme maturation permease subunit